MCKPRNLLKPSGKGLRFLRYASQMQVLRTTPLPASNTVPPMPPPAGATNSIAPAATGEAPGSEAVRDPSTQGASVMPGQPKRRDQKRRAEHQKRHRELERIRAQAVQQGLAPHGIDPVQALQTIIDR